MSTPMYQFEPFDKNEPPAIGVVLVRQNTGSRITIDEQEAYNIMAKVYMGGDAGGYYRPNTRYAWKTFVFEFFPGWKIDRFLF